ncbi:MAG: hypothetical protein OHK0046_42210 [Anaerolineae bacterium]
MAHRPSKTADHVQQWGAIVENIRYARKQEFRALGVQHKLFTQDEICQLIYPSYKNILIGRSNRLPDRDTVLKLADYLECTPNERNALLRAAYYLPVMESNPARVPAMLLAIRVLPAPDAPEPDNMMPLWQSLASIIQQYQGRVELHLNDLLVAVWDDPHSRMGVEHSIHAALLLRQAVLTEEPAHLMIQMALHMGVVTFRAENVLGEAMMSGKGLSEVMTLQQRAAPGDILISHGVYRQVQRLIDADPLPSDALTYRLFGRKSSVAQLVSREFGGVTTQFIGREQPMQRLREQFQNVVRHGQGYSVTVIAEPGLGKSRLVDEFIDWLENQSLPMTRLIVSAAPYMQRQVYGMVRQLLAAQFGITDDESADITYQKLFDGFSRSVEAQKAEMMTCIVGTALGFQIPHNPYRNAFTNANQLQKRAETLLIGYFESLCQETMLLLLIDDVHWADPRSLELFRQVQSTLNDYPFLTVFTARPDLLDNGYPNDGSKGRHLKLWLSPLAPHESRALIHDLLRNSAEIPEHLLHLLQTSTEGNPFFIQELVRTITDQQNMTLTGNSEHWNLNALAHVDTPAAINGVLQERLHRLPSDALDLLRLASVIGIEFPSKMLHMLRRGNIDALLGYLIQCDILVSKAGMSTEYCFRHALLHQVVYDTIPLPVRRALHQQVAEWLAASAVHANDNTYASRIAAHFDLAEQFGEAVGWYIRAGRAAQQQGNLKAALHELETAEKCARSNSVALPFELYVGRESVLSMMGDRHAQLEALQTMEALAQHRNDTSDLTTALVRFARYYNLVGERDEALRLAELVTTYAAKSSHVANQINAYCLAATLHTKTGNFDMAERNARNAYALAQDFDLENELYPVLTAFSKIAYERGDYETAQAYDQQNYRIVTRLRDETRIASLNYNLGGSHLAMEQYSEAFASYERAYEVYTRIGLVLYAADAAYAIAQVSLFQRNYNQAIMYFHHAQQQYQQVESIMGQSWVLDSLGQLYANIGDYDRAQSYSSAALPLAESSGYQRDIQIIHYTLARIAYFQGDHASAARHNQTASEIAQALNHPSLLSNTLLLQGFIALAQGELTSAEMYFVEALQLREKGRQRGARCYAQAALALCYMAQQRLLEAHPLLVSAFDNVQLCEGMEENLLFVYTVIYLGFTSTQNALAQQALDVGWELLNRCAETLPQEVTRDIFVHKVKVNRVLNNIATGQYATSDEALADLIT